MPRCGCLPAAPDTQPSPPQDLATLLHPPAPTSPFGVPEGYLSGQGLWGALPQQGAPGLSQGQTIPAQVPCPRKLEGHVSTSGVTPDMHPCTVAPLSRGLHSRATSYRSFCRCHHWTALAWNPWQGSRGQSSWLHGHRVHHRLVQIWATPWPSQPGEPPSLQCQEWGSALAAGQLQENLSPPVPPSHPSAPSSLSHPHAPAMRACAAELARHWHLHPWLWERAGNAPCNPVPVGFSCCTSL